MAPPRWMLLWLATAVCVRCSSEHGPPPAPPTALSVTPSVQWYGDDGSWSAISIRVGTPPQWVDVMVSTVSAETWVVGTGSCEGSELMDGVLDCLQPDNLGKRDRADSRVDSACISARGGVFDTKQSTSWQDQGFYNLGSDSQLGNTGYGDYGLDDLTFGTTGVILPSAIIASFNTTGMVNTTQYLLGEFGIGIVPGSFGTAPVVSAISGLVENQSVIPSHSYGFTAGATYREKGTPLSLTLGGYDANRFIPHDISFELNPSQAPQVFLASVSVSNSSMSKDLLLDSDRVTATIDSSTPYLWLPPAVCDRFAQALELTYDDDLNVYTFGNKTSQHKLLRDSGLTFSFGLSDISTSSQAVNISLPYDAFDLQFTFPALPDTTYGDANASLYYFPLRRAAGASEYTIGRSFLQEAYIITDYERNNFSIHQAVHTAAPLTNTSIVSITRPPNSPFTGPATGSPPPPPSSLSTGAIIGIAAAGVLAIAAMVLVLVLYFCRRRLKAAKGGEKSPRKRKSVFGIFAGKRKSAPIPEIGGDAYFPTEVAADASHERFELPAPLSPVELDSSETGTLDGTTVIGLSTLDTAHLSEYERARRKMERQMQAQHSPTYPQPYLSTYPTEKSERDTSDMPTYRPSEGGSPLLSSLGGSYIEPNSASTLHSPVSAMAPDSPVHPPAYRRIESVNAVYAGRLPPNIQLPAHIPRLIGVNGRTINVEDSLSSRETANGYHTGESDLYGSDRTEELYRITREGPARPTESDGMEWGGGDLVHVPVVAETRFSFEEERAQGRD